MHASKAYDCVRVYLCTCPGVSLVCGVCVRESVRASACARANERGRNVCACVDLQFNDAFFNRVLDDEADSCDGLCLPDAMQAIDCLHWHAPVISISAPV